MTDQPTPDEKPSAPETPYDDFGGAPFFASLVDGFYTRVATDPILRPMYPDDLAGAQRRLELFLAQYWGGPQTYSEERGHPRLRMRHNEYTIDAAARDRWLALMHESLSEQELTVEQESRMWLYLVGAAFAMQNVPDEPYGIPTEGTR